MRPARVVLIALALPLLAAGGGQAVLNTGNHRHTFTGSGHSFTVVQVTPSVNCASCTFSAGITSGNSVVYACGENGTSAIGAASMTGGTTVHLATTTNNGDMGIITGVTGGSTAFTAGTNATWCTAMEVHGVNASTPVDIKAGGTASSWFTTGTKSLSAITTTGANDTLCFATFGNGGTNYTAGSGYSIPAFLNLGSPNWVASIQCSTSILSASTYTPTTVVSTTPSGVQSYGEMAFILQ